MVTVSFIWRLKKKKKRVFPNEGPITETTIDPILLPSHLLRVWKTRNPKYERSYKIGKRWAGFLQSRKCFNIYYSMCFTPKPPSLCKHTWSQANKVPLVLNPLPVQRKVLRVFFTCLIMALDKINMEDNILEL